MLEGGAFRDWRSGCPETGFSGMTKRFLRAVWTYEALLWLTPKGGT